MVSRLRMAALLALSFAACDAEKTDAGSAAPSPAPASASEGRSAPEPGAKTDETVDISPAKAAPGTWMAFSSKDDRFEARFPVAPKKDTFQAPNPLGGTIPNVMYMAEQGKQALGVNVMTLPEPTLSQFDVDGGLDGGRDGMINNIGGTIVSEQHIDFAGHPARAIEAKANNAGVAMRIEARLFFVSPRMYQLIAVSEASAPSPAKQFFESFSLLAE